MPGTCQRRGSGGKLVASWCSRCMNLRGPRWSLMQAHKAQHQRHATCDCGRTKHGTPHLRTRDGTWHSWCRPGDTTATVPRRGRGLPPLPRVRAAARILGAGASARPCAASGSTGPRWRCCAAPPRRKRPPQPAAPASTRLPQLPERLRGTALRRAFGLRVHGR